MGLLASAAKAPFGLAGLALSKLTDKKKPGMPSLPGQSPLGMGGAPGAGLSAASGQRSPLG